MDILSSHNGSEVAGLINEALADSGSATTIGNESGSIVSGKLNEVFGNALLDSTQSGDEWTQTVEEGFDMIEQDEELNNVIRFLHFSDPHGNNSASSKSVEMLSNDSSIDFAIVTGDVSKYGENAVTDELGADLELMSNNNKLLILPGNHDTYDMYVNGAWGQKAVTNWIKGLQNGMGCVYGDPNGISSYWHKDIALTARTKLRIIALDQYEKDVVRRPGQYYTVYSQAQIDWFIAKIKELNQWDYLIIAMHEPPVQNQGNPDSYAVETSSINGDVQKLFVTNGLTVWGNRGDEPSLNLFPRIMRAYLHKEPLSFIYNNKGGTADIVVDEDFTNSQPANFLFYIGGHQHCDICYYLPNESNAERDGGDWSDQLMLFITAADRSILYGTCDDLGQSMSQLPKPSPASIETYRLNMVSLDFGNKTILIERFGDKNTSDGRVRTSITFPFKKGGLS